MKKIIPVLNFIIICLFMQSCEKEENNANDEVSFIIKDELTLKPVQNAWVYLETTEDDPPSGKSFTGYTDKNGVVRFQYDRNYPHFALLTVTALDYEFYNIKDLSHFNRTGSNRVILKARNSRIKLHFYTQSQVAPTDSVTVSYQNIYYSSYADSFTHPLGSNGYSISMLYVASGYYHLTWSLKRNNAIVSDSAFYINVPLKDTVHFHINY